MRLRSLVAAVSLSVWGFGGWGAAEALAKPVPKRAPVSAVPKLRAKTALQVNVPYASIELRTDQPLANAKGGSVELGVAYSGSGTTASVQVPDSGSYPIGPFHGSFQTTVSGADMRALLKRDELAIVNRCKNTLTANGASKINTVFDTQIPFIVAGPDGTTLASTTVGYQLGLSCVAPPPALQVTLPYAKIEFVTGEPLATAKGGAVDLSLTYNGAGTVASIQVPGALSYPLGTHIGGFSQTVQNADVRALLKNEQAAIETRCVGTLNTNSATQIDTVHDAVVGFTVNGPSGNLVASTNVPYQLGLTCKRALLASIGYTKITVNPSQPLANATGGLVPFSVTYNGSKVTASVQVPGALSYPLGAHNGAFQQTVANADIRAILKPDEAKILKRCKDTLEFNKVTTIDTVHDAQIAVTVNAADGSTVAATTVPYQLGLTCVR